MNFIENYDSIRNAIGSDNSKFYQQNSMNFTENHDSIRNAIDSDNSQFYQNSKKSDNSNRSSSMKHDIKSSNTSFTNNGNSKSSSSSLSGQSRLNCFSNPFVPKQQFSVINDSKALRPDISGDSTSRIQSDHDNAYYSPSTNVNYDGYNSNLTNQCLYNAFDIMPICYQYQSPGTYSNYWSLMPNNYNYGLSNLGLSASLEPNQNVFMMGKTSENLLNSNNTYSSAVSNLDSNFSNFSLNSSQSKIQSNSHQIIQNRKTPQLMKTNNSLNMEAPAPGLQWHGYEVGNLEDKQIKNTSYSDNCRPFQSEPCKSEEMERRKEILSCISDPKIKKSLSETMQNINPSTLQINIGRARFFVIKSYSEDDLHRAIKYGVWCSTKTGNSRLDAAYRELNQPGPSNLEPGRLFLFFSVNGSGFFAGIAEMISSVNNEESCGFWSQNKWVGKFKIKWHYVKDVRNSNLRHIRSEANENKPVTNSRDAVEVTPYENGVEFIKVFHHAKHETSVFDDFEHYEQREMDPNFNV